MHSIEKRTPYHIQAYDLLKEDILNHRIVTGERIVESALAQKFQISRSPIREALRMLECDKLLVSVPGGLTVNPLPAEEVREIYACRTMLESYAARLTSQVITDEQINYLFTCVSNAKEACDRGDVQGVLKNNTEFHEQIVKLCQNSHLLDLYNINRNLILLSRSNELYHRTDSAYSEDHWQILEALRSRNGPLVENCVRNHIENDLRYYVMHLNSAKVQPDKEV